MQTNEFKVRVIGYKGNLAKVIVEMKFLANYWLTIKTFQDEDIAFAKREAEELLEALEGGKDVNVKLID